MHDQTPSVPDMEYWSDTDLNAASFGRLGRNARISKRCSLIGMHNIYISDDVIINGSTVLSASIGRITIGRGVRIADACFLGGTGGILIGDFCRLSQGVHILSSIGDSHEEMLESLPDGTDDSSIENVSVRLRNHVVIGAQSVVVPGCEIGEGALIEAQSLVANSLAPWGIYAGAPARLLHDRPHRLFWAEAGLARQRGPEQK
jgi:acetyltransferase-like isoleucine patch superfamily enzyme